MDFFYTEIENSGPATARIGIKGHAPLSQFLNSSFILQYRVLEQFHEYVDITLGSEFGKELKKQRSIQVEGAFGVIKEDMGFTRFRRRGMKGVTMEFLLVCLGYNLKKYHMYRLRQEKKNALKAC